MKKLLLSSIIMLGVCGIAAAQTDSKVKRAEKPTFSTAAGTTQKSTISANDDAAATAPAQVNSDGTVAPVAAKPARVAKTEAVATVDAAGVVSPADEAKTIEEKKARANAASPQKIGKKQN